MGWIIGWKEQPYAFRPSWVSDRLPDNVAPAMRISVMLHLPADCRKQVKKESLIR